MLPLLSTTEQFLAEIERLCDPDGRLGFTDTLRQVCAVAA